MFRKDPGKPACLPASQGRCLARAAGSGLENAWRSGAWWDLESVRGGTSQGIIEPRVASRVAVSSRGSELCHLEVRCHSGISPGLTLRLATQPPQMA